MSFRTLAFAVASASLMAAPVAAQAAPVAPVERSAAPTAESNELNGGPALYIFLAVVAGLALWYALDHGKKNPISA